MAMLQVAINPLLRVAGGEKHFAFFSVAAQLVFGLASFISPQIYSYLVSRLGPGSTRGGNAIVDALAGVVPPALPWVSMYWVFMAVTAIMVAVVLVTRFPRVELAESERAGAWATHRALLRNPHVLLYALGIFCYVGAEQGIANWISQFLSTYHGFDPQTLGRDRRGPLLAADDLRLPGRAGAAQAPGQPPGAEDRLGGRHRHPGRWPSSAPPRSRSTRSPSSGSACP